jgi:hypothetical protein
VTDFVRSCELLLWNVVSSHIKIGEILRKRDLFRNVRVNAHVMSNSSRLHHSTSFAIRAKARPVEISEKRMIKVSGYNLHETRCIVGSKHASC